jgi:hypothetical protein
VVGLTNIVIADVPTPIGLPFAFFPMSEKSLVQICKLLDPDKVETNPPGTASGEDASQYSIKVQI